MGVSDPRDPVAASKAQGESFESEYIMHICAAFFPDSNKAQASYANFRLHYVDRTKRTFTVKTAADVFEAELLTSKQHWQHFTTRKLQDPYYLGVALAHYMVAVRYIVLILPGKDIQTSMLRLQKNHAQHARDVRAVISDVLIVDQFERNIQAELLRVIADAQSDRKEITNRLLTAFARDWTAVFHPVS